MLHHLSPGTEHIDRAAQFYDTVLAPLGDIRVWSDLRPDDGVTYVAAFVIDPDGHRLEAVCKHADAP